MADAAEMVERQSLWDRTDKKFIGEPVGVDVFSTPAPQCSIPCACGLACPVPAAVGHDEHAVDEAIHEFHVAHVDAHFFSFRGVGGVAAGRGGHAVAPSSAVPRDSSPQ